MSRYNPVIAELIKSRRASPNQTDRSGKRDVYSAFIDARLPYMPPQRTEYYRVSEPEGKMLLEIYEPPIVPDSTRTPCHINYHGGAWMEGHSMDDSFFCSMLSRKLNCTVVNVNYRLAPKFPFPTSNRDCAAAFDWVTANADHLNIDVSRLSVGGTSAGGHLAMQTARHASANQKPLVHVLLNVPACDLRFTIGYETKEAVIASGCPYASRIEMWDDILMPSKGLGFPLMAWLQDETAAVDSKDVSIMLLSDKELRDTFPATTVIASEIDPLRDEAVEFERRLKLCGVDTCIRVLKGMPHAYSHISVPMLEVFEYYEICYTRLGASYTKK